MLGTTTRRLARILAACSASVLLASCVPNAMDTEADEPLAPPVLDPAPDTDTDSDTDSDSDSDSDRDDGAVDERPAVRHDWDDLELEVRIGDGWVLRDCDGDAPVRCLHGPDGSARGAIELSRFEQHDRLAGADDVDRAAVALHEVVTDFEQWLLADRGVGCPQHTVELEPIELTSIDGAPAAIRGHRVLTPQGEVVERSLAVFIADGDDLALVTVMATAPGGCTHVEELDELTPTELDHLHAELRTLMRPGSIPQG